MPTDVSAIITFDRTAIQLLAREIAVQLRESLTAEFANGEGRLGVPAHFLVSSKFPDDLLRFVEAPDVTAGERNEPHWKVVQEIRRGDIVFFRDSTRKALVGWSVADHSEKGLHRHFPNKLAIRWRLKDLRWFDPPISDEEFRRIFAEHDRGTAGFKLFRESGEFSQKTYAYPLEPAIGRTLLSQPSISDLAPP